MAIKHKFLILMLKYIPFIVAFLYAVNTILTLFGITISIGGLYGISVIPLIFFYIASYAFSFCNYHRIFLHYIAGIEILNALDLIFKFPISTDIFIIIQLMLFIICAFVALYLHMKKHELRVIKTRT